MDPICLVCKSSFKTKLCRRTTAKFCTYACKAKSQIGKPSKKRNGMWKICDCGKKYYTPKSHSFLNSCSMECRNIKMKGKGVNYHALEIWRANGGKYQARKGMHPWNKGKSLDLALRKKMSIAHGGNGTLTQRSDRKRFMERQEYILWRKEVFERDNYTCQLCGARGGELEADHILPYSLYPELRTSLENGRSLCRACHLKTDTYGGRVFKQQKEAIAYV